MDRRAFVAKAGGILVGVSVDLRAQGTATMRRIGFLSAFPRADVEAFLSQLRPELEKLGWTDGRNIVLLEPRTTDGGENERLPSLAGELVAQGPDLILVQTVPATRALMQATKSIPIVMVGVGNPVELWNRRGLREAGWQRHRLELPRQRIRWQAAAIPQGGGSSVAQRRRVRQSEQRSTPLRSSSNCGRTPWPSGCRCRSSKFRAKGDFEPAFAAIRARTRNRYCFPRNR